LKIIFIPISIIFIDQLSKIFIKNYWFENNLLYSKINIIGDYLRFVFIENPGIAFGIDTSDYSIIITFITFLAVIFISSYFYSLIINDNYEKLPIAFILGGAIGNFIDRFLTSISFENYNGVVDFIDLGIKNFRWYTFNIADLAITIGLIIFLYQTYFLKKQVKC